MAADRTSLADEQKVRPHHAPHYQPRPGHPGPPPQASAATAAPVDEGFHWARWIVVVVIAGLAIAGGVYWWNHRSASAAAENAKAAQAAGRAVPEVALAAQQRDLPVYIDALGTVTPLNTVTVRTRVDGQVDRIAFTEGQLVEKDSLLAQIDPRPFQVQLEQAEGQLARDQANLSNAQVELARDKNAADAIPKQQVDTQQALVDQAAAATKIDQAQIDNARLQLTYCKVTAPFDGIIGLRQVDVGNIVHAADTSGLAVITQVQPITVVFSISEDQLPAVLKETANEPHPSVDAYDRDLTANLATGTLLAMDNQVDPTTGMVKLKAQFGNAQRSLYPNQFVNARLHIDTVKNAVIAPAAAVQRGPDSTFVYVVKPDQTVDVRTVTLGPTEGDLTAITSGLSQGEIVVTDGVDKLQPGSKVSVRAPGESGGATTQRSPTSNPAAARGTRHKADGASSSASTRTAP